MSAEENKALVRRFYEEVWDRGNTDFVFDVFAEDYVRRLGPGSRDASEESQPQAEVMAKAGSVTSAIPPDIYG
jgi:ketosteroid isomerase-like protein